MRYKNSVINPKNLDNRCFQDAFALTQHYKEIKNHSKRVSNIKPFVDIYNWNGIEYSTVINKNNYTLFEKRNTETVLIVLFVDVNVETHKAGFGQPPIIHKSTKQWQVPNHYHLREKNKFCC